MPPTILAILDTCVLFPAQLRDLLLDAAYAACYEASWSDETLIELERNVAKFIPEERAHKLIVDIGNEFKDATVEREAYESLMSTLLNHPKDRHVLAAAIACEASIIVTENLRDFPSSSLQPYGIRALSSDEFLLLLLERNPTKLVRVVRELAGRYRNPPMTIDDLLARISRHAPEFVARLRDTPDFN